MMSADASASAIALVADKSNGPPPVSAALDLPFKPGDRWTGSYHCSQGRTDLVLVFEDVAPAEDGTVDVGVIFDFRYDGLGNAGFAASSGSARMRGKYEIKVRRLRLKGEEWIDQPASYKLVNLVGTVNKVSGGYTGTVEGPGCTSFSVMPEHGSKEPPSPQAPRSLPRPRP